MKTIIVDDEPKAIELLKGYTQHFSELELVATFRNGLKALNYLNTETVELILLDINIPHISGLSLSKMISKDTKIIFTTAYSEYAVESYEVNAVDYLLKPISFERFAKAISKVLSTTSQVTTKSENRPLGTFSIKSGARIYQVKTEEIAYLEKDGNYMIYHHNGQRIFSRQSVAEALDSLPESFIQVHKSFVVNTNNIDFFDKNNISVQGKEIVIGPKYKEAFLFKMGY
ncbi:MAG: DNA-binding response regulator [Saprospiraceae bacterium]|nr:MAG: DNA-binding response regulator [Saprospiraceae bacterium]